MTDVLSSQGFEIVTDANGQELIKMLFIDENNETTGYALVSPDDAKKILSGEASLQNVIDEDGKQVLTLVPVDQEVPENMDADVSTEPGLNEAAVLQDAPVTVPQTNTNTAISSTSNEEAEHMASEEPEPKAAATVEASADGEEMAIEENAEQYTISEQTAILDGQTIQMVTLVDAAGQIVDQKHGQIGEQVVIELHGQALAYEMRGPTETGEAITSTLLVSTGDPEEEEGESTAQQQQTVTTDASGQMQWTTEEAKTAVEAELPVGEQYTLTEAVNIVDGKAMQTVILEDDKGQVIDHKQGHTGDHTIIELNGHSLDYVFLGPSETGEPITTVLVVTADGEDQDGDQDGGAETEAGLTAADWCPPGLPQDLYTILRRRTEALVNERLLSRPELNYNSVRSAEPYHRKLGPYAAYQEMVELSKNYAAGASQGESADRYEVLKNYAKIFRTTGPQARSLTVYEMVVNEVASQLCRFKPGLLFHKRELFQLAKSIADSCHDEIEVAQAQVSAGLSMGLSSQLQQQHQQQMQINQQNPQETAQVSGQVANSQLAMLESRGLTAIQPTSTTNAAGAVVHTTQQQLNNLGDGMVLAYAKEGGDQSGLMSSTSNLPSIRGKQAIGNNTQQHYLQNMSMLKRDMVYKLAGSEEEALRLAALNSLSDILSMEVKPKSDCTNTERASWEHAVKLAAATAGGNNSINILVNDASRVDSVRELAALYGRVVGLGQPAQQHLINPYTRTPVLPILTPYEVACNEAAAYLVAGQPALLTRRRELVEMSRKVVRNSGCQFTHTPNMDRGSANPGGYLFYCADQMMELDLSAAEQLLHDPLERIDLEEDSMSDSTDDCPSLNLSCEEHNILDEASIYAATGTDTLKKVRILNLTNCSFTGIIPFHLNQCANLIELNLANNSLHALPRCLYLPKLRRLNLVANPLLLRFAHIEGPPLIEQFPRLNSVELDFDLKAMLKPQALAYLCNHLTSINGEDFQEQTSEETIKIAQAAKQELAALIHSKWEDDLVEFYKKGVPYRDLVRVIETLVLHAVNHSFDVKEPFSHCKTVLARRIADEFLAPKVIDEDDDEEHAAGEFSYHNRTNIDGDQADTVVELEQADDAESSMKPLDDADLTDDVVVVVGGKTDKVSAVEEEELKPEEKEKRRAAEQAAVAEREAVAAALNMALLPDEPLDKISSVIGMAMQHGKTVVYSVIRTAARQPNGELIPVGNSSLSNGQSSTEASRSNRKHLEDEYEQLEDTHVERKSTSESDRCSSSGETMLGYRRPGLLARQETPKRRAMPSSVNRRIEHHVDEVDADENEAVFSRRMILDPSSGYGDLDEEEEGPMEPKVHNSWEPGKRGRPPLSQQTGGVSKSKALAAQEEEDTSAILQNVKIPPPHSRPPSTLHMSTRDSNRMKRFSAYGAIDTAAALAGQQKALIAAAFAQEDDDGLAKDDDDDDDGDANKVEQLVDEEEEEEVENNIDVTMADSSEILRSDDITFKQVAFKKKQPQKKLIGNPSVQVDENENAVAHDEAGEEEIDEEMDNLRHKKDFDDEATIRALIDLSVDEDSRPPVPSLLQLGDAVDYDPLHFIRCHARDNDPLDCSTKVWRCAFEPNPLEPKTTTTVVATCGGECVCLIDCRSGKVMKRFKHVGEEFYSIAWTSIEMASGHKTNLLAAAGKLKEIRLLHPEQLVCYAEMRGHKAEIACMIFHPTRPTILFSGDSKAAVIVWDVGIPSASEYRTKYHLLMRLACPRAGLNPVLNLIFMPNYETLLAGCEDGVFAWTLQDFKRQRAVEDRLPTLELKIPTRREPCFDGLARLSENLVVVKCVEEGELYVFDFSQLLLKKKRTAALVKRPVPTEILGQLRWQTTEEIYINVTARPGLGAVVCGDNEGTIWLYDLQANIAAEANAEKFKMKPVKILEWPECSVGGNREDDDQLKESITSGFKNPVVNATDISSDGHFLVAVTDNNLVCIWNFSG